MNLKMVATWKVAQLLVPEPLLVVSGAGSCDWRKAGQVFQRAGVPNLEPDCSQYECKIWKCHLALMLWAVVSEDTTKS